MKTLTKDYKVVTSATFAGELAKLTKGMPDLSRHDITREVCRAGAREIVIDRTNGCRYPDKLPFLCSRVDSIDIQVVHVDPEVPAGAMLPPDTVLLITMRTLRNIRSASGNSIQVLVPFSYLSDLRITRMLAFETQYLLGFLGEIYQEYVGQGTISGTWIHDSLSTM